MSKASIRILAVAFAVFLYLFPDSSFAQTSQSPPASDAGQGLLSGPQLEALVSPIALYPAVQRSGGCSTVTVCCAVVVSVPLWNGPCTFDGAFRELQI